MRFALKTLMVIFAVALLARPAEAASFTTSLDRDAIALGESATLSLTFEGGQPQNLTAFPPIANLSMQDDNRWSQNIKMDMVSGQSSVVLTHDFTLTPQTTGEFVIPSLAVDLAGQHFSSSALKLTVTRPSAATNSGNEAAFVRLTLPKEKVYVGETIVAKLAVYLRDDVMNHSQPQFTGMPADGFLVGKGVYQNQYRTQIGNRIYTVIPAALALTVAKTGALSLGPFTGNIVVILPVQNQSNDPLMRFLNQGEQRQVTLATETVNVESLPLPKANQPAYFTGAVGNFTMTATAGPTTVTAGDPITVRVKISGSGALDSLSLPAQNAWHDFKTYPPTAKIEPADQFGFQGTKTFEQIVSPLNSDVHELPPLTFAFFNPDDGQYHTLTEPAVQLLVHAAGATPLPQIAATKNPAPENQAPQDILPIKQELGPLTQTMASRDSVEPLLMKPAFLAVQALPVLAFFAAFIWRKRVDSLANNPRLRRQRAVAVLVASGLLDLKKFAAENKSDEFFALLFRLLQEQLGERLDCPASAITESVVGERLAKIGASPATLESLHELFQLCNQARYAPVRGSAELNSVAAKFEKTIAELQEVKA